MYDLLMALIFVVACYGVSLLILFPAFFWLLLRLFDLFEEQHSNFREFFGRKRRLKEFGF